VALSACRVQVQVSNRQCCIVDEKRNIMALLVCRCRLQVCGQWCIDTITTSIRMGLRGRGPGEVYWLTSWSALFLMSESPVGCRSCVSFECMLYLFVVDFCFWLSGVAVGCQVLNMDCQKLLSVVSGYLVSLVGCRLFVSVIAQFFFISVPNSSSRQLRLGKLIQ
jgi:hypothetical protein